MLPTPLLAEDDSSKRKLMDRNMEGLLPSAKRRQQGLSIPVPVLSEGRGPHHTCQQPRQPAGFDPDDLLRQQEQDLAERHHHHQQAAHDWAQQHEQFQDLTMSPPESPQPPMHHQPRQRQPLSPMNGRIPAPMAAGAEASKEILTSLPRPAAMPVTTCSTAPTAASQTAAATAPATAAEMQLPLPDFVNLKVRSQHPLSCTSGPDRPSLWSKLSSPHFADKRSLLQHDVTNFAEASGGVCAGFWEPFLPAAAGCHHGSRHRGRECVGSDAYRR